MPTIIVIANNTEIVLYYVAISIFMLLLFVTLRYATPYKYRPLSYLVPVILYSMLLMYSTSNIFATQPAYNFTEPTPENYTTFISQPLYMSATIFYLGFGILIIGIAITLIFFFRLIARW